MKTLLCLLITVHCLLITLPAAVLNSGTGGTGGTGINGTNGLNGTNPVGAITNNNVGAVTFSNNLTVASNITAGTFTGNGAGMTNLPITALQNNNSNTLVITNGNVGIGTTSPATTLEVVGTIRSSNNGGVQYYKSGNFYYDMGISGNGGFAFMNHGNGNDQFYLVNTTGSAKFIVGFETGNITQLGSISGGTSYSGSGNITSMGGVLTISGTGNSSIAGNVGIGTTSPSEKLEVAGNIKASSLSVTNTTGVNGFSGNTYFTNSICVPTNDAPSNVTLGVTAPDRWFQFKSPDGATWFTPAWTNH